ncbi:response regulator transcription factor [Halomonas sp. R57-5]|uniref:response regulator transcription factor n=1 Tax=Halomonas sp. R57-5 TaxID=1610576 RepID=UPI0009DE2DE4|nr:LuxR C-terminal-related transcriptional regulator [Halomonas sp. R57-5]
MTWVVPRLGDRHATPGVANQDNVSRLVINGASNKEAARALGISPSTVGTHVESIFRKLNCATRAAATLKALTAGLL